MPTVGNTSRPAYVYDSETDTWIPIGVGPHTHDYVDKTLVDAKGDLLVGSAADTLSKLSVGSADQVLTVDSSTTTGLKWATPSAGAYTSLATGSLSTNSVTISSISGSYTDLKLLVLAPVASSTDTLNFRVNGITSSNYSQVILRSNNTTLGSNINAAFFDPSAGGIIVQTTNDNQIYTLEIANYTATGYKSYQMLASDSTNTRYGFGHQLSVTSAITSITIKLNDPARTFTGGTYTLYGVK